MLTGNSSDAFRTWPSAKPIGLIMSRTRFTLVLVAMALLSGCVALGWRFGPVFSCKSTGMFAEPPIVVHRGPEYFLAWTYGKDAFFFRPGYKAMDGRLVFVLQGTSSSGNVSGRYTEMKIEGAENLLALQRGGAVWWEPDGSHMQLEVVEHAHSGPAGSRGGPWYL